MKKLAKLLLSLSLVVCVCFFVGYSATSILANCNTVIKNDSNNSKSFIESLPEDSSTPTTQNPTQSQTKEPNNNENEEVYIKTDADKFFELTDPSSDCYIDTAEFKNFKFDLKVKVKKSENVNLEIDIKAQVEKSINGLPNILAEINCNLITKNTTTNVEITMYIKQNVCYVNVLGSKYKIDLNNSVLRTSEAISFVLDYVKDFDLTKEIEKAIQSVKTNPNYLKIKNDIYNNTTSFEVKIPTIVNDNVVNTTIITLKDNKFSTLNYTNLVSKNVLVSMNMSLNDTPISFPNLTGYINL